MRYVLISGPEPPYFRIRLTIISNTLQIMRNSILSKKNFFAVFPVNEMRETSLLRTKFSREAEYEYITVKFEFTSISVDPVTRLLS